MNTRGHKAAVLALTALTFATNSLFAASAVEQRSWVGAKKTKATTGRVTGAEATGVRPMLYGITVTNVAAGMDLSYTVRKHKPAIERVAQDVTKDSNYTFVLPYDVAASVFGALGAGVGTGDTITDEIGYAWMGSKKIIGGYTFLPTVAALMIEKSGKTDLTVAKIFSGRYGVERFNGVFSAKKAEIEKYLGALGYLSYVFVDSETITAIGKSFGFKDSDELTDAFVKAALEYGYRDYGILIERDGKRSLSVSYVFAGFLAAIEDAVTASYPD